MASTGDTLPRGNSDANAPKLLVYVDRNVETTMSSSKKGKKSVGKKHTEVVSCYQSKDGTEGSKENEPAIVINREMIDWSVTEKGNSLETLRQCHETFKVNQHALFASKVSKDSEKEVSKDTILDADLKQEQQHFKEDFEASSKESQDAHEEDLKREPQEGGLDKVYEVTELVNPPLSVRSPVLDHKIEIPLARGEFITVEMKEAVIEVDENSTGDGDQKKSFTSRLFHSWPSRRGSFQDEAIDMEHGSRNYEVAGKKSPNRDDDDRRSLASSKGLQPVSVRSFDSGEGGRLIPEKEVLHMTRRQISIERNS